MRVLIQRVEGASVEVGGKEVSRIGAGMLVLLGIHADDTDKDLEYLVGKVAALRIFDDADGVMNLSLRDTGGEVLLVSQFTLLGSCRKGNRPSYIAAAKGPEAEAMYLKFRDRLASTLGRPVPTGVFGAHMKVSLCNDGPVTIWMDSRAMD